jgi:hypothetical protein
MGKTWKDKKKWEEKQKEKKNKETNVQKPKKKTGEIIWVNPR